MVKTTERGIPPKKYTDTQLKKVGEIIDAELAQLEREAVNRTPSNTGALRGGWFLTPFNGKQAILSQSKQYYLPVEIGRKPGKGISEAGQRAVARWAKLKLGITDPKDATSFAYGLSQKYKRQGREPQPILDLTTDLEAKSGGLLDKAFKEIDKALNKI